MLRSNELYERYQQELQPVLSGFDSEVVAKTRNAALVLCIGIAAVAAGYFLSWMLLAPGIIGTIAGVVMSHLAHKHRRDIFKTHAVSELLKWAYPGIEYTPDKGISSERFKATRLYSNSFDRYSSEDLLYGTLGETALEIAEIHTQKRERRKNKTSYKTLYHGVMIFADFNKEFKGRTVVFPDVAERYFGSLLGKFLQSWNMTEDQAVHLEDPEFEKLFSVYSSDQIEARYILTPDMMSRLVKLRKYRGRFRALFDRNLVIISFEEPKNYLEPPFFGKISTWQAVKKVIDDLNGTLGIVEMLSLNTRIWTKQ